MSSPRILIVGGVAAGASAATRARRMNESAEIVVFEKGEHVSFANCGLPYHIAGRIAEREKLLVSSARELKQRFAIDVRTRHEVQAIDRQNRRIKVLDQVAGESRWEPYDRLILAPGASPMIPPWEGVNSSNVFTLRDVADMDRIKAYVDSGQSQHAVVIGAGFIGLEMVEALVDRGLQISVIEQQPQVLPPLDPEMAREIQDVLDSRGVTVLVDSGVAGLTVRDEKVVSVRLNDGREIPADFVLVSIGVRPNVELARDAGLAIGPTGGIAVNEYLQTSDAAIYAVGDAAETVHAVTGQVVRIPLAGPANRNGRLAGEHAATGESRAATPVAGTAIVQVFGKTAAMTGLSVKAAARAGLAHAVAYSIRGHHAGYYPGAQQFVLKLIYDPATRRVLGAQAVGGEGVDKRIDVVATVIHFRGTIDDIAGLDLAYAPQFGAAKDPLHIAAFVAQNQTEGLVEQVAPGQFKNGAQLVDVRSEAEFAAGSLPGAVNIPLDQLRSRLETLSRTDPVTVFCQVGQRGYTAARILQQHAFSNVRNLAGGYRLHAPA